MIEKQPIQKTKQIKKDVGECIVFLLRARALTNCISFKTLGS